MEEQSFKVKVEDFWKWWTNESQRIFASVSLDGGVEIQAEMSLKVNWLMPGFAWVFGKGENNGHSFTLSGEGNRNAQLLTYYWKSKAPDLEGWTFHSSRQAVEDVGPFEMVVGDVRIAAKEIWLAPFIDEQTEEIDLMAWNPQFETIGENDAYNILFLLFDEVLGEFGTENWIGKIELGDSRLKSSVPLSELPEVIKEAADKYGWEKGDPNETYNLYEQPDPPGGFARADIFVGSTRNFTICRDYMSSGGNIDDPVHDSGAEYVFVQLESEVFPSGTELEFRSEIEDLIWAEFEKDDAGYVIGGAMGIDFGYIDLLLFNGQTSRDQVEKVLSAKGLDGKYEIVPFATGELLEA